MRYSILVAAALSVLALSACDRPTEWSHLRPLPPYLFPDLPDHKELREPKERRACLQKKAKPVETGSTGMTGAEGAKGEQGKQGDGTIVVVPAPASQR